MNVVGTGLVRLRGQGFAITLDTGGRVLVTPKERITPEIKYWLLEHQDAVQAWLRAENTPAATPPPKRGPLRREDWLPNSTHIPNTFLDEVAPDLSEAELRVMLYLMRRTYGFRRAADEISLTQFCGGIKRKDGPQLDHGTGMGRKAVVTALTALEAKGLVVTVHRTASEHGHAANIYRLALPDGEDGQPP